MNILIIPMIMIGIMLLFGAIFWIIINSKNSKKTKLETKAEDNKLEAKNPSNTSSKEKVENAYRPNAHSNINKEDIFKFMEFDKIEDDMIIQKGGTKYTAVIKCKGINYALMSDVEQLAVEEGFINFLNTLRYGVQIYVQAQTIDLKESVRKYKENMQELDIKYDDKSTEYNILMNSLESTDKEIDDIDKDRNSIANVLDYGNDIIKYVERLSLNKNMLQRSFYVLVSYYSSEISVGSGFKKEEIADICYNELYTRVENIISGLATCSVACEIVESNDIAELLYSAYNRDDKNYINVKQALDSGFHRLYSTSEDAIQKKNERLREGMKKEAEYKAISALARAVEEGTYVSQEMAEDIYDKETSKKALDLIKNERIDDEIKLKAKNIVVEEYKKEKQTRLRKIKEELEEAKKTVEKTETRKEELGEELKEIKLQKAAETEKKIEEELNKEIVLESELTDGLITSTKSEDNTSEENKV